MYDAIIIGGGPAGLSAAINLKARNRNAAVFTRGIETSFLYRAEKVNNHLGMPEMTGKEMLDSFLNHARNQEIEIKKGRVLQVLDMGDFFGINFENDFYQAKTVILATGIKKGKKIAGEEEFLGRGVSYCATCDGMLYRNKDVVVVGEIKEAEEDVNFLADIAGNTYFIPLYGEPSNINSKVKILKAKPVSVKGGDFVEALDTSEGPIKCSGAFFVKESTPANSLLPGIAVEDGMIVVNRYMETNLKGVYACGDCTGWPYQISNAVGEGLIAAQQADRYLRQSSSKN